MTERLSEEQRLSNLIEQRRSIYKAVGTGEVQHTSFENTIKIGRTREKLSNSIHNLENRLNLIIRSEELKTAASIYDSEVRVKREQIKEITHYVEEKHIEPSILEMYQTEYAQFLKKAEEDEDLKRGLELLRQDREKEKAEKEKEKSSQIFSVKPIVEPDIQADIEPVALVQDTETNVEAEAAVSTAESKETEAQPRIDIDEERITPEGTRRYYRDGVEVYPEGQVPAETQSSKPEEEKEVEEKKERPKITIESNPDTNHYTFKLNGRIIEVKHSASRAILLKLAEKPGELVTNEELEKVKQEINSGYKKFGPEAIYRLRKDFGNAQIFNTIKSRGYLLNADVEFIEQQQTRQEAEGIEPAPEVLEKPEEETLPKIVLDKEAKTLMFNDKGPFALTVREVAFLTPLYEQQAAELPVETIKSILREAGFNSTPGMVAFDLEKKIGQRFISRKTSQRNSKWSLPRQLEEAGEITRTEEMKVEEEAIKPDTIAANVPEVEEPQEIVVKKKVRKPEKTPEEKAEIEIKRAAALKFAIENPQAPIDQALQLMPSADTTRRSLLFFSLQGRFQSLVNRLKHNINLTDVEIELWQKAKELTGEQDIEAVKEALSKNLTERYKALKQSTVKTLATQTPSTAEEENITHTPQVSERELLETKLQELLTHKQDLERTVSYGLVNPTFLEQTEDEIGKIQEKLKTIQSAEQSTSTDRE